MTKRWQNRRHQADPKHGETADSRPSRPRAGSTRTLAAKLLGGALAIGVLSAPSAAAAVEPASCLLPDPSAWPSPSKPYFMIAVDSAAKMNSQSGAGNPSCGAAYGQTLLGHGRCAVKNTVLAYAGQVNLGLATSARVMSGCGASCYSGCVYSDFPNSADSPGCGPESNPLAPNSATRQGANIVVPLQIDDYWNSPPQQSNAATMLSWVDNDCTNSTELFADSAAKVALNGMLRDMYTYLTVGWTSPLGAPSFPSPLGTLAQGERSCRSLNVILVTAGDEGCDQSLPPLIVGDAINAAQTLNTPFMVGGNTWTVKTFIIAFGAGVSKTGMDAIAAAGGTGQAYLADNESQLALALSSIIGSTVSPETCDNADNNCNGCTDEGYAHYCNTGQTCCVWATAAERTNCLATYQASITPANPGGNLALLPCTTAAQQTDPTSWLCSNPKETCDEVDNNCDGTIDENQLKCGNPLHCPTTEICNSQDDDCDGLADEPPACSCLVTPSPEVCDGCDNDCDGFTDNGILPITCGLQTPVNCIGTASCNAPVAVTPGGCIAGGGFGACSNSPQAEICDGIDNNCNGVIDDGVAPTACGMVAGLVYGGTSQCKLGTQACGGACLGVVGPSSEVCDGIDNDCDGIVDETPFGVGQPCGFNAPPCQPGTTACVNGAIVCQGGTGPQAEVCDGIDNNCNGVVDDTPLADAPLAGQNGCWNIAGNTCTHQNLSWDFPPGADCYGNGSLTPPCNHGTLACAGGGGWICQGSNGPVPEVCDGLDNNCNGLIDDGNLPQVGQSCGTNVGVCVPGTIQCVAGSLPCVGATSPTPELCNGLDDDCDGVIDNGVAGGTCDPIYDTAAYPGDRSHFPCKQGITQCNGQGGLLCVGSIGPSPEVCDGIDNDCDGLTDETAGAPPDSIAGTANPNPPPAANIGDACGQSGGECSPGQYACVSGAFVCAGAVDPVEEACDCNDNDCDGVTDNQNPAGGTPLCSAGKECVKGTGGCFCAEKCTGEVQPCPGGQKCESVTSSELGTALGNFCVPDPCPNNCFSATTKDANGKTLCAPEGTVLDNCEVPPQCKCNNVAGCQPPCYGVTCPPNTDLACTNYGPNAGTCVADNCFNFPCPGCNQVCNAGACLENPCTPESCPGGNCKPNEDFTLAECYPSCLDVVCQTGEKCEDGLCVATCEAECAATEVCDESQTPPVCVPSLCTEASCPGGEYCDPLTGNCGNDPCEGILCATGETCSFGHCSPEITATDAGTAATSSGASTSGGATEDRGVWGLATGGGGCACETGVGANGNSGGYWALVGLGLALGGARRRRRAARAEGEVSR